MYPDVQDLGNAVGPIEDGLFVDGMFVDGLFVDGLFVDGLFVVGLFVNGFVVDGLVDDGFVVDGLLLVGLLVGLVCSARVVITFSSVFTSTRTRSSTTFGLVPQQQTNICLMLETRGNISCFLFREEDSGCLPKNEI